MYIQRCCFANTLYLICLSLIKRDFQEAKDLRLVVTLSKGTRAGAAIAMDDIKVIFQTIFETRHFGSIFQVRWLAELSHEAAEEVQHQQELFPEVTDSPENNDEEENGEGSSDEAEKGNSGSGDDLVDSEESSTEGSGQVIFHPLLVALT